MRALYRALAKFQLEHSVVARSASGSFGPYSDLSSVLLAVRGANALGLSVTQTFETSPDPGVAIMRTTLCHEDGASIDSVLPVVLFYEQTKRNTSNQQLGMTVTYLRRYATMAILGLASEDLEDSRTPQAPVNILPQNSPDPNDDFGLGPVTSAPAQTQPALQHPPQQGGVDEFGL